MLSRPFAVRYFVRAVVALALTAFVAAPAQAQRRSDEYYVKAAFLYNFVKFVQWPPSDSPDGAVVIGVLGRGPLNEALQAIVMGKSVNGRAIVVRQVRNEDDAQTFHMIFIGANEARRTADILKRVGGASVVTVGETPHFLSEGGIVQFHVRDNRVRFDINSAGANQAGLRISSQLLSLARQ